MGDDPKVRGRKIVFRSKVLTKDRHFGILLVSIGPKKTTLKCRSRVRLTPKLATLLFALAYCTLLEQKNVNKHCYCSKTGDILGVLSRRHRQFFTKNISKTLRSWRYLSNPANQVETFKIYQNRTKKL